MAKNFKIPYWIRKTFRFLLWTIFSVIVLVATLWLLLQLPVVQNYATNKALDWISEKTDHKVVIDKVRIAWFDEIEIQGLQLDDFQENILLNAKRVLVDYDLWDLIQSGKLEVQEVYLEKGSANLIKYSDSTDLNLNVFLDSFKQEDEPQDTTDSQPIYLQRVMLEDFIFSMDDKTKPEKKAMDFSHMHFDIELTEIFDIRVQQDSISLDMRTMSGKDSLKGIDIRHLEARMALTNTSLIFDDLQLETPGSFVGDSVALSFNSPGALAHFTDSVSLAVRLENSIIASEDIKTFTGLDVFKKDIGLSTYIVGKIGDLSVNDLRVVYGNSYISSQATAKGLPDFNSSTFNVDIRRSRLYSGDLKTFVKQEIPVFEHLDAFDFKGSFVGQPKNFKTEATISSAAGLIQGDMGIEIPEGEKVSYTGHLNLKNLDVGLLLGDTTTFQKVTLKGRILGNGTTRETAAFVTDFEASKVGIKGYEYDSVDFKGFLAARHFYGRFNVNDPNCRVKGRANVDLRKSPQKLSLNARIDTLFTKRLNLTADDYFFKTQINWKQTHLDLDSLDGSLKLLSTEIRRDSTEKISMQNVEVSTHLNESTRSTSIEMPGVKADLNGQYTFSNLAEFFDQEISDLLSYFQLGVEHPERSSDVIEAAFQADFTNANPYIQFFKNDFFLSEDARVEASFRQAPESDAMVLATFDADSIISGNDAFVKNHIDVHASMSSVTEDILASFLVTSGKQRWKTVPASEDFQVEGVWFNDKIDISSKVDQPQTNTKVSVNGEVILLGDSIHFRFKPSEIIALRKQWNIDSENLISITQKGIRIETLDLKSGTKLASINGIYSDSVKTNINFMARNIQLGQFNKVLNFPAEGELDADFTTFRYPGSAFQFSGNINLSNFMYKNIIIGNINATSYWDDEENGVRARLSVDRENFKTISADGYYYPDKNSSFDIDLTFDQADFKMLEVVTEGNLSNLKGQADGSLNISGTADKPVVKGDCEISNGAFLVDYLQTRYDFGGKISFEKDKIDLTNFILRDVNGDRANFQGNITHRYFKEINTDLHIDATNFQFLNTTASDNPLYYGSAVASGDIYVTGPLNDLLLKVKARTEKGTNFHIPLDGGESFEQAEFISFVDLSDTTRNETTNKSNESDFGLTLDFDLEVTNDAYTELIFDIRSGDIIRGRGSGNLNLLLDKNGNFELYGPLTISEGAYNFTVPGFINKEFTIQEGGTITWYGDPYAAEMALTATYRQQASFAGLLGEQDQQDAVTSQRYPVLVILNLDGEMLSPNISFDIQVEESASQPQETTRLLAQIRNDDQQLKRQVVSLLFFKKFSPLESSFVGGGGSTSIGESVSEYLTNQISYLASQLDENLEVEVDLTDLDREGFETFQLRLAYTFMDGRLRVSRGGDFTSAASQNNSLVNDIIGDWSVEYMLTKDGKLRAKMFSRSNQSFSGQDNTQNVETGLSLRYITSFNNFKDLMGKTRAKAIQRREDEEEVDEEITSEGG